MTSQASSTKRTKKNLYCSFSNSFKRLMRRLPKTLYEGTISLIAKSRQRYHQKRKLQGFLGGLGVKNPPANADDMGLTPDEDSTCH